METTYCSPPRSARTTGIALCRPVFQPTVSRVTMNDGVRFRSARIDQNRPKTRPGPVARPSR
jgi:hypothetical protein